MNETIMKKPIKIGIVFSLCTILLYFCGAYDYPKINQVELILFLIFNNLAMYYGFTLGTRLKLRKIKDRYKRFPIEKVMNVFFWISLFIAIPKFIIPTGMYDFSISNILVNFLKFFTSPSEIYANRLHLANASGIWQYINYIVVLSGSIYWTYTCLAMLLWKRLKFYKKIGTLFIWGMYLLQYICTATNVGFFDFMLSFIIIYKLRDYVKNENNTEINLDGLHTEKKTGKKRNWGLIMTIVIIGILLFIFNSIMDNRIGTQYTIGTYIGLWRCDITDSNFLWTLTPDAFKPLLAYLTRYLAASYNALAMSFELPYESTFGIGYSWFLLDNSGPFSQFLWDRTYNMRLNYSYGYDYYVNWHTMYLWFANDVSLLGVPVILFMLFMYFGMSWKSFILENNIYSFLTFMIFSKMMYFVSANNQVFQNADTLIAFWILVFLQIFYSKFRWGLNSEYKI